MSGPDEVSTGADAPTPDAPTPGAPTPAGFTGVHGQLRGAETLALTRRVDQLEAALELGGAQLDPAVVGRVRVTLERVRERLELGVDHTVVALAGGTGSGKSSLFNAVCGLDFADVGVKRPTTSQVTACVWGEGGTALLDWLGVLADRRIERESLLDGDAEMALRGLVLLDLPDHDSIEPAHRVVVDRLLPMADLLIWVVDPQKYADDALHSGYLRQLVGHEAAMAVVLNHVDTVPPEVRPELLADLERLLVEDGLEGVTVLTASALTGEGVTELRTRLAAVVLRRSVAAERAGAEINDAATVLASQVADGEPGAVALGVTRVVDVLAEAAGLPAIADAVGAVVRGGRRVVPAFGTVQGDTVELARTQWLTGVTRTVPGRWQDAIVARVASSGGLGRAVNEALARVAVVPRRSAAATRMLVTSLVLGGGAVLLASVALGARLGSTPGAAGIGIWPVVGAGALLVLASLLGWSALAVRRVAARRRVEDVLREGRSALEAVARGQLAEPAAAVLADHRRVRELTAAAATR